MVVITVYNNLSGFFLNLSVYKNNYAVMLGVGKQANNERWSKLFVMFFSTLNYYLSQ